MLFFTFNKNKLKKYKPILCGHLSIFFIKRNKNDGYMCVIKDINENKIKLKCYKLQINKINDIV
jgi:hypothetical protein